MSRSTKGAARLAAAALAAWLVACGGDDSDGATAPIDPAGPAGPADPADPATPGGPAGWTLVSRAPAGALSVAIYAPRALGSGLVPLALRITDGAGASVAGASVSFAASRARADGTTLAAPVLGAPALASDGTWRVDVVLPEAAPAPEGWSARVGVARPGSDAASASFAGLTVLDRGLARLFTSGGVTYALGVRFDAALRVGLNPVTVALHASPDGGATWSPVGDATFDVVPEMPAMGHGAPGSVAPAPTGVAGAYAGAVAFSMTGEWQITFLVTRGGVELGRPVVSVYF